MGDTTSYYPPAIGFPRWRFWLALAAIFLWSGLSALDIPFFAEYHSDNRRVEYLDRDGKELSWQAKNQIALGVDNLKRGDLCLDLRLATQANFIEQQVLIDRVALSYQLPSFRVTAVSRPQGIAKGYFQQQLWVAGPYFNQHQYAQTRFNGLELSYTAPNWRPSLGLGGNPHTLAAWYLSYAGKAGPAYLELRLDGCARDPHWNLPQSQPSLSLSISHNRLVLRADTAVKHILANEGKPARDEGFAAAELQLQLSPKGKLIFGGSYLDQDYSPRRKAGLDLAWQYSPANWDLIPAVNWSRIDGETHGQARLLGALRLAGHGSVGLYGIYDRTGTRQSSFTVGLQSSLRADF